MAVVQLDGGLMDTWPAFHDQCQAVFGFPEFYGRNMDAWIDCMSGLRDRSDSGDGMTRFALAADETLEIELIRSESLRKRAPAILTALEECVEEVNMRCAEHGEAPVLSLILR